MYSAAVKKKKGYKSRAAANAIGQKKSRSHNTPARDNPVGQRQQTQQPIQLYEAGTGNLWHVHKDHVKFNGDNGTRINFKGRTKSYVRKTLAQYHSTMVPKTQNSNWTYVECDKWIRSNLPARRN